MFELIGNLLAPIGLRNPTLELLNQDEFLYSSLLFQPSEEIEFTNDFIRNRNNESASSKFRAFFNVAVENHVALAVSPEYSCPWNVISELVANNNLPEENKLWIIGCESIKARALRELFVEYSDVSWVSDHDLIEANLANEHFFNPVCYIFKTRSIANNAIRTVILIQFKTSPLGGVALQWERDNFIHGRCIYILENRTESSRLATLICSDAINQHLHVNEMPGFTNYPYLIVHIQLNPAPNNPTFRSYRAATYNLGRENKEFICLNWSCNLTLGDIENWNPYGGSAIYIKGEEDSRYLNITDERLDQNQKLGMYYSRWSDRYANIYFLNYNEHLFLLRTTKVSQLGASVQQRQRTGPAMLAAFSWENGTWETKPSLDSGFPAACAVLNTTGDYATLLQMNINNPLNVERLVYLSIGQAVDDNWYSPKKIAFLKVGDDEISKKITFTQTPCDPTQAERKLQLLKYGILEYKIITNPEKIPDNIKDLKNNCSIRYVPAGYERQYNLNLFPSNGDGTPATGVFIGTNTSDNAQDILSKIAAFFKGDHFSKRIVIWFHNGDGELDYEYSPEPPKITDNTSQSTRSFRKRIAK